MNQQGQVTQRFEAKELRRLARMSRPPLSVTQFAIRGFLSGVALVLLLKLLGF